MILRSIMFSWEHSRLGGRTPSPQLAFEKVNASIARFLAKHGVSLTWPTLAEVQAVQDERFAVAQTKERSGGS